MINQRKQNIIYNKLPILGQNLIISSMGLKVYFERYGGNFNKHYKYLLSNEKKSTDELIHIQNKELQKLVRYSYLNVPYYEYLFKKNKITPGEIKTIQDLKKIPILTKDIIRKNPEKFLSRNMDRKKLIYYPTGGTTGTPLRLYMTKDCIQFNFALAEARIHKWAGVKFRGRVATFLGRLIVPVKQKKPPFWRYNVIRDQLIFSTFHMNEEYLYYYTEKLLNFKPKVIIGYASSIYTIADYIVRHDIRKIQPKAIIVSSETLFSNQRRRIERAFNSKVYNCYSSAENIALISECEKGSLHISPEYGIIELIDTRFDQNEHLKEILVTGLKNYSMPFIRYKIGDLIEPADEKYNCPCNRPFPIVKNIIGRIDESLKLPDGRVISAASLSLAFQNLTHIKMAQILQPSSEEIIVRIVVTEGFNKEEKKYLGNEIKSRLGYDVNIKITIVDKLQKTKAGKTQFILRSIK